MEGLMSNTSLDTKLRNYRLDNAKSLLIVLVVFAHIISNVLGYKGVFNGILWCVINAFHMPCFLIISGYLAYKRIENKEYAKVIQSCFIPFLFAQFGMFLMFAYTGTTKDFYLQDGSNEMVWLRPMGALWYIFAIGCYIISTSIIIEKSGEKYLPWIIVISLLFSIAMGYGHTIWYFRLTKMIAYYPYFFIGYYLRTKRPSIFNKSSVSVLMIVSFVISLGILTLLLRRLMGDVAMTGLISMEETGKFTEHIPYDYPNIYGPILRIVIILLGVLVSISLITIMPNRKLYFTRLGENSIYIYILHWFLIRGMGILRKRGFPKIIQSFIVLSNQGYNVFLIVLPITILLCLLLQNKYIRSLFRPFIEPRCSFLFGTNSVFNKDA